MSGTAKDRIHAAIFILLLVPSAFAIQWTTGLWSWADAFVVENPVEYSSAPQIETGMGCLRAGLCFAIPLGSSVLLCWGVTWALYRGLVRNR